MLISPTTLSDKLLALARDLDGLPGRRVALLGFRDPNAKRVAENVQVLCAMPGWPVIDLRSGSAVRLPDSLVQVLSAPKLALLVDVTSALPPDASLLIRALHDSRDSVQWVDGTRSPLPSRQILYVVAVGARSLEELPTLLQKIDFMTFVDPLK